MIKKKEKKNVLLMDYISGVFKDRVASETLAIEIADYICSGNLVVRYGTVPKSLNYDEILMFDEDNFNWDIVHDIVPGACQLYLQGFAHIWFLINAYEIVKKDKYLKLADKLIYSWIDYEANSGSEQSFMWYDHSVSERALVLIYFDYIVNRDSIVSVKCNDIIIKNMLNKHGQFLYLDENYTTQNHGTMIDRTLYSIGVYLDNDESNNWVYKAKNRIKEAFNRDFSENMVNLENSPEYHIFNLEMYLGIEKGLFNKFADTITNDFDICIKKAIEYLVYLSKPNYKFPMFGDGIECDIRNLNKSLYYDELIKNDNLKYILSAGKYGIIPEKNFKIYNTEGYVFFRNKWDMNGDNNIYVSFKAGYKLKNHKHGDDLSITMYAKGQDVFVDSGTYTYEAGEYRRHFMSAMAHNTIIVDDKTYPFIQGNPEDTRILDSGEHDKYYYVIAINNMYLNTSIIRTILFIKNGDMIIIDNITSNKDHKYSQIFNLSPGLECNGGNEGNIMINVDDENIDIKQLYNCEVNILKGDKSIPSKGLYSTKFNKIDETNVIEFCKYGKNEIFVTGILQNKVDMFEINEDNKMINYKNADLELMIDLQEATHKGKELSKRENELTVNKVDEAMYLFSVNKPRSENEYAWYIESEIDRDVIWYSDKSDLTYVFNKIGKYTIKYFVLSTDGDKKMFKYSDEITIDENSINKSKVLNEITPYIDNCIKEEVIKKSEVEFDLKLNSKLKNCQYAWYILDDNNNKVDVIWYRDQDSLSYTFNKEGKYKVQYFILDKYNNKKMFYINEIISIDSVF